ncbi:hypothetical protein [Sodalinema gerasimenkoae]|uniref:hypothetical protein n=1 Tax=Sodalinema gerasimenkoae TaxID=2862348 RepID=UPI00135CDA5E|nr:hypothetical protein [Sodalinema gerasimenkoae]
MEQWDFLIQREGDRVWLPLAEGHTRLSPGRYRVVARSHARETLTEVCVRYEPPPESEEAGQFYRSTRQTDDEGTVLVLPATDLKVGSWSLSCSLAALRRDRPDAPPQGLVRLYVRPDIEIHPEPPVADIPESAAAGQEELALIPDSPSLEPQALDLRLELAQDNYRLQTGEALMLSGRIHSLSEESAPLSGLHLRIRLREPQSLHVVTTLQRLLPPQTGFIEFSYPVAIPESCHSRLILGEVVLCNAVPTVLAKQSFVVTARLETLLDELADGQIDRSLIERSQPQSPPRHRPLPPPASRDGSSLNSNPPNLEKALPPRLNLGTSSGQKPLDLPSFGKPLPEAIENPFGELQQPIVPELPSQKPLNPAPSDDVELDAALESPSPDPLEAANPSPSAELGSSGPSSEAIAPSLEADLAPSRFSSRLNDIAKNEDLSEWLTARAEQANETNPFSLGHEFESSLEEASEVVVDDDPRRPPPPVPQLAASPSPENPVPTPELIVPTHTLAVGRPALIRVRLQQTPQRVYVKLWIHDRQNQLLLDGPRWLTDFFPVEDGLVESMIRLTIPKGGVDLQFEAIAVDMDSERESYKVAIARRVAPPGLPSLPLTAKPDN